MKRFWQLANIISLSFALVANYLVGAQVLNLPSISEISDKYATYLTPAGYAFSIWSLIYVLLIIFVVYQARDLFRPTDKNDLPNQIGPWFILASIFNGLWTYLFVNEMVAVSVVTLVALTASLYVLLWRLNIAMKQPSFRVVACVWWPLMIYAGWVTVASVVNIASWVDSLGFSVSSLWSGVIIAGLGATLLVLLYKRHMRELVLAATWGIVAIGVQQINQPDGSQLVVIFALTVSALLIIACGFHAYINRRSNPLGYFMKRVS